MSMPSCGRRAAKSSWVKETRANWWPLSRRRQYGHFPAASYRGRQWRRGCRHRQCKKKPCPTRPAENPRTRPRRFLPERQKHSETIPPRSRQLVAAPTLLQVQVARSRIQRKAQQTARQLAHQVHKGAPLHAHQAGFLHFRRIPAVNSKVASVAITSRRPSSALSQMERRYCVPALAGRIAAAFSRPSMICSLFTVSFIKFPYLLLGLSVCA